MRTFPASVAAALAIVLVASMASAQTTAVRSGNAERAAEAARARRSSRQLRTAGIVLMGIGVVALPVGIGMMRAGQQQENDAGSGNFVGAGAAVTVSGGLFVAAGVPLLIIGLTSKPVAGAQAEGPAAGAQAAGPAATSLVVSSRGAAVSFRF